MHDTTIAAKLLGQLESFLGRISPHFHKPVARFIGDMVYGIMVEKDVKLSSVVRALKEKGATSFFCIGHAAVQTTCLRFRSL